MKKINLLGIYILLNILIIFFSSYCITTKILSYELFSYFLIKEWGLRNFPD